MKSAVTISQNDVMNIPSVFTLRGLGLEALSVILRFQNLSSHLLVAQVCLSF
jgi:hypothetical protein